jgi:hypothetical protein
MRQHCLACIVVLAMSAGIAAASIVLPTPVTGKDAKEGTTTDPRIQCRAVLWLRGNVDCHLTLRDTLLSPEWVQLELHDGTGQVVLSARLEGFPTKDGTARAYKVSLHKAKLQNSYLQLYAENGGGENLVVLLHSVEIYDDWTHKRDIVGWSEERVVRTLGPPDFDSRDGDTSTRNGAHELRWSYGEGKDISVSIEDKTVIKIDHWRNRVSQPRHAEPGVGADSR